MVMQVLKVSERRACQTIGQIRSTQRYEVKPNESQEKLEGRVLALASEYGRYGYRQVTNLLNMEGFSVGKDRVFSIWQREGLNTKIMCGLTILCLIKPMTEESLRF